MPDIKEASLPPDINLIEGWGLYPECPQLRVRTDRVSEEQAPEKIVYSDKTDFKFTAAYEAYSKAFDGADATVRGALNDTIAKLHDDKMDYNYFYSTINQHIQGADKGGSFRRARIEGQRKQEYNKDERKRGRNERYR
jgi:hypothetical protein